MKSVIDKELNLGYSFKVGSECEFYLFKLGKNGNSINIPQDFDSYCDIAPLDKGENIWKYNKYIYRN